MTGDDVDYDGLCGRCLCGAVTWQAHAAPNWQGNCHCRSCRRANAAPFVGYIAIANDALSLHGRLDSFSSSPGVERAFCATCHTPIFYRSQRWPDETHMMAATLEDPDQYRPQAEFHMDDSLSDFARSKDLPRFGTTAGDA